MERYKCRTCLDVIYGKRCTAISKMCYLDQTIKEIISLLVPAMASTLSENDLICRNCLKIIKSTMKFIERCLEVEIIYAESKKREEDYDDDALSDCVESSSEVNEETILLVTPQQVEQDHDYSIKSDPEDCVNVDNEISGENDTNFHENSKSEPVEIIYDSSTANMEESDDYDNFQLPIEFVEEYVLDNSSSSYPENNSEDAPKNTIVKLETYNDMPSDIPIEYVTYEEECKSEMSVINQEEFSCPTCFQEFTSKYEFNLHLEFHPAFICQHCNKAFKTEYAYTRHMKLHEEGSFKICEICGKLFSNITSLNIHITNEHDEILYMCDKCPKRFKTKFKLSCHVRIVHEKIGQQQCQKCGKLFQNKESCENHLRLVHLQIKPFVCDVCGRDFGRKDYLQKHMYYHTGEPRPVQFRNKEKSKGGRRGKPPKFGIRLKDPGIPVNCKICGKMISSVHLLKSHLQSHVKIKRHKCGFCELTFTLSNNRDRHQRLHEVDPEKKFRTEEELASHMIGHYNRPPQHSCDICGEKFHRKYLLDNHILDKHTGPGDIERAEKEIVIDNLLEYAHPSTLILPDTNE
ncbi:hypothetical protein NQ314_000730 [Rhamnusium bicolor]|uniref:C2H2-type domain-containing protein n=1 Tax=Rhamnusium bicolor TaxID=1586634 RepID=A0AAV8ZU25_9CUCU|nr:hypothetical protein NQ314_000730 [Rhamnusium bicolor]